MANKVENFVEDMEAGEMLLWLAIIVLAIYFLFFWQGSGIIGNFTSGAGGIWNGLVNFFKTGQFSTADPDSAGAPGGIASSPTAAAQTWNTQYLGQRNPDGNPFDPQIYADNPSAANITPATAQSIASTVYNAGGSFFTSGDITSVLPAFQQNCQTWIDVALVAQQFQASENQDLLTYMNDQFNNNGGASSNNANQLQTLVQWCVSLPQQ